MSILKLTEGSKDFKNPVNIPFKTPSLSQLELISNTDKLLTPKILSIDDNRICQKVNATWLKKLGCLVNLAGTACDALEKLSLVYDIIFLDINLPDFSGELLIDLIRTGKRSVNKHTPIVMMTSWIDGSLKRKYLSMGVNRIFVKPIAVKNFESILKKYVIL